MTSKVPGKQSAVTIILDKAADKGAAPVPCRLIDVLQEGMRHRESAAPGRQRGAITEVAHKELRVKRGRHQDDLSMVLRLILEAHAREIKFY